MAINSPQQFMQLLMSPNLDPNDLSQMAQALAMKTPPPGMVQPPGMDFMLNPQEPAPGFQVPLPMQPLPQEGGAPQAPARTGGVLDPRTVAGLTALMTPRPQYIGNPAPPHPPALVPMVSLQTPAVHAPMSLAQILGGRNG